MISVILDAMCLLVYLFLQSCYVTLFRSEHGKVLIIDYVSE